MTHTIRRALALSAVAGAVAAPAASAMNPDPGTGSALGAPSQATVGSDSASSFDFGDAAIGAGTVLLVLGVGGGTTILVQRRRSHLPPAAHA